MELAGNVGLELGSSQLLQRMANGQLIGCAVDGKQVVRGAVKGLAQALHKVEADALLIEAHQSSRCVGGKTVLGEVAREAFDSLFAANTS